MNYPRVSIIIASYNRAEDLRLSLQAIVDCDYPNFEILVVDNASSDNAAEIAASFSQVRLIQNQENVGFAQANNQGLRESTGDYVALINNDAVIAKDWIQSFVDLLEKNPDAAAAGGKIFFWNEHSPLGNTANKYYGFTVVDPSTGWTTARTECSDDLREVATLSGAVVMIRRAAIEDTGGAFLEPDFFAYYEETDFFARAIRRGWKLLYSGNPVAWHRVRASTAKEPYRYFYFMERNRLLYAWRNFPDRVLLRIVRKVALEATRQSLFHPLGFLAGKDDLGRAKRDAYAWALKNTKKLRQHRADANHGLPYDVLVNKIQAQDSPKSLLGRLQSALRSS